MVAAGNHRKCVNRSRKIKDLGRKCTLLTKGLKRWTRNAGIRDGPEQESQREAVRSQGEYHGRREIRGGSE